MHYLLRSVHPQQRSLGFVRQGCFGCITPSLCGLYVLQSHEIGHLASSPADLTYRRIRRSVNGRLRPGKEANRLVKKDAASQKADGGHDSAEYH